MRLFDDPTLPKIAGAALAIRWGYSLAIFATLGDGGLLGIDSQDYLVQGQLFAAKILEHSLSGWQWAGTHPYMMPLFTWLVALCALAFGTMAALGYVLLQGAIDTATCVLVYRIAQAIDARIATAAAVFAAINPTQIVMAGMLYSDTPFVFFAALCLLGGVRWLSLPGWRAAVLVGVGLGGAILLRPLVLAFAPAMIVYLALAAAFRGRLRRRECVQLLLAAAIFGACTTPIVLRHQAQFGIWSVTPQGGMHLNRWVVPLIREAENGTPWQQGYEDMERRTFERYGPVVENPFEQSKRYSEIAWEELRKIGVGPTIKAWAIGAAINLGAPGIILSPPIAAQPRTGFYSTPGANIGEKIWNFAFGSGINVYAAALLLGLAGVAVVRLIQAIGAIALALELVSLPALCLLCGWVAYILLVNGPVASPKYRLPIEPVLCVMAGRGWTVLTRRSSRQT